MSNLFYRLDPCTRGQGVGSEAAAAAVEWSRQLHPARPVIARVRPANRTGAPRGAQGRARQGRRARQPRRGRPGLDLRITGLDDHLAHRRGSTCRSALALRRSTRQVARFAADEWY
jgi:hypothetical protein